MLAAPAHAGDGEYINKLEHQVAELYGNRDALFKETGELRAKTKELEAENIKLNNNLKNLSNSIDAINARISKNQE
ncbi:hypothetical protein [Methylobacterium sp. WL8]|uniref:hypothetical protein n=1 Tax=Methylobacterium sp. WL8 TaxID=2603899 RepID=UPI0011C86753|nr:hypothetical protein [Methylobacterium sp. WL8]TXN76055.1 hypothetical protein FV234_24770 [Methylobacterium sp. WL8]